MRASWQRAAMNTSGDHEEMVKFLLSEGADVNARDDSDWTPLCEAVHMNCEDVVAELITHGADVNVRAANGMTPLHIALTLSRTADIAMIKLLISNGADVNARNSFGETPLHAAVDVHIWDGDITTEAAQALISAGADVNAKDQNGTTPLDHAIENDRLPVATLLRGHGAKSGSE